MNGLADMRARYEEYSADRGRVWGDRLVWCGVGGDMPNHATSIPNYMRETLKWEELPDVYDARTFHKEVTALADDYVMWCNSKDIYTPEENECQRNFLLGAVGEMFFCNMINDLHRILLPHKHTGDYEIYEFNHMAPRFADELDYGVDLTGTVTYRDTTKNCAVQVKFWNPETGKSVLTNNIVSGVCSDAMCSGYVSQFEDNNIVLCWLGDMDGVSLRLKRNANLFRHLLFIDNTVLDANINGQNPDFWTRMLKSIKDIRNY